MSKRPRATRSTKRQRPRPSATASRPSSLTGPTISEEVVDASAPAARISESAPASAAPAPIQPRAAASRPSSRPTGRPSGLLAQKAATEYVYVAQDLRRIGTFAGGAAVVMILVWLLVDLVHVIPV